VKDTINMLGTRKKNSSWAFGKIYLNIWKFL